ncbi:hypothetical protein FAM22277_02875 [Lacticaseibacillus paracasei]|nr:hypothetical protein FAM22277_02875 [Lacticaseibacillus paracasei]
MIDLRGKRILFTGRLRSFRRFQAQQLATILGAKPVNGIDKNVDILVVLDCIIKVTTQKM